MIEFVDSDLYFVQDKNNFMNPLLQVGSGSVVKSTGSGSGGPKIIRSDRIRILIPDIYLCLQIVWHLRVSTQTYTTTYNSTKLFMKTWFQAQRDILPLGPCRGCSTRRRRCVWRCRGHAPPSEESFSPAGTKLIFLFKCLCVGSAIFFFF